MRLTPILLLLISLSAAFGQQKVAPTKADVANAPLVTIEELFAHPEQYDGLIIRVNALWVNGYHGAFVCHIDGDNCIGVSLECPESERCQDMRKVLNQNLKAGPSGEFWDTRGRLFVIGRFKDTKEERRNDFRFFLNVLNVEGQLPHLPADTSPNKRLRR
jgi:hypothetical protein